MIPLANTPDYDRPLFLIKTMRALLNNRRELDRLIVKARENIRAIFGDGDDSMSPGARMQAEILRLSTGKKFSSKMIEEADTILGSRFRYEVNKIENEYNARKKAMLRSQELLQRNIDDEDGGE